MCSCDDSVFKCVDMFFVYMIVFFFFFFFSSRRRHTRWPRDWSSDVCSSDLERVLRGDEHDPEEQEDRELGHGRRGIEEAAPRKSPEEEEHGRDIEDDEDQSKHIVLKVKLDLRHPFRHLAAFVCEVFQRRRMVRSK